MKITLKSLMIFIAAAAFSFSSCKKTEPATPGGSTTGLLKTMTQIVATPSGTDSTITMLSYDSQNRIITQIAVTTFAGHILGADTTTYAYNQGTVVQYSSASGTSIIYTLNSQGFRVSDNLGDTWTYNTAGYMTQSTQAAAGTTTTYTYNAANQLATETSVSNNATNTYTFTYSADPIGKAGSSWSQGQSTGNLFATEVEDQNGTHTTLTATYTLNSQGELAESSIQSSSGSSPIVTYYAYY